MKREFLCTSLKSQRMDGTFDATGKRECSVCLQDLYLSAVRCSCSDDKFACLNHAKQLCSCAWSDKIMLYRYEISELDLLCQALDGKLSAVYKWAKQDLGLTVRSVASKRPKQTDEKANDSTRHSEELMKERLSPSVWDSYSKWKQRRLQAESNASERNQNEVASQAMRTSRGTNTSSSGIHSEKKTTLLRSTSSNEMKANEKIAGGHSAATNSAGTKTDRKAFKISKKVEDPKVSAVSSTRSSRYLSLLQENTLFEVSSDSTSSSCSSESEEA